MQIIDPLYHKVLPVQSSRKRGKFSTPPLSLVEVVGTRPVRNAAFTVVLAAMREERLRALKAFVSCHTVDKTVTASPQIEAGNVPTVLVVPRLATGQL